MPQSCAFCKNPLTQIQFQESTLSICPTCHATFLSAKDTGLLRRDIDEDSRRQWMEFLLASKSFTAPVDSVLCIGHAQPLFEGTMPKTGQSGLVAPCCDTLHLSPAQMAELLKRSLSAPLPSLTKKEKQGFFRTAIAWFTDKIEKPPVDDGFGGMVWATKLKPNYLKR